MQQQKCVFLGGLHRSGTSLLHEVLKLHPEVAGFSDTNVPEDEGQHLQNVYMPAYKMGGPGKFAFDRRAHMTEKHPLANDKSSKTLMEEWGQHVNLDGNIFIEKSPPNLLKTRFLQSVFPNSKFVIILRHPIAVAYATKKWSKTSIPSLLEHTLLSYETFLKDAAMLNSFHILRYEDFVKAPDETMVNIYKYLDLEPIKVTHKIKKDVNSKYFSMYAKDSGRFLSKITKLTQRCEEFENRANKFGYSIVKSSCLENFNLPSKSV